MTSFTKMELYGGAITAELPSGFIDSSNLREIPSHQEVWLSPTTLTNVIIEINQYETSQPADLDAIVYHFKDVIDERDTVQELSRPTLVEMKGASVAKFPAYTMSGIVVETEKAKSVLPADWEQTPQMVNVQTIIYQLVVRMKDVDTDLCVRINVPTKEFGDEEGSKEKEFGKKILGKIVESLEIVDFGLFEG